MAKKKDQQKKRRRRPADDSSVSSDDDESHVSSSSGLSGSELRRILESLVKGNAETRELLATAIQQRIIPTVRTMNDCPAAATVTTNQFSFLAKLAQSFIADTQEHTIPTTVHTTENSRAATTITGSALDTADMKHALNQPNTKSELRCQIFISTRTIFV